MSLILVADLAFRVAVFGLIFTTLTLAVVSLFGVTLYYSCA
ncbi:hypothetical protein [Aeromonas hydrophila]